MQHLLHDFFARVDQKALKTPFYIFYPERADSNIDLFKPFIESGIKVFFALKSNNYEPFVQKVVQAGFGFDVASYEELRFALHCGAQPKNISFSAPSKREIDIARASALGVRNFAFDSEFEVKKIMNYAENPILFARLAVWNKEAAFDLSSKFGMNESYFLHILKQASENKWPLRGLTFHVGSQNTSLDIWPKSMSYISRCIALAAKFGVKIDYVNLGGGIPVSSTQNIPCRSEFIHKAINECKKLKIDYPHLQFIIEPGRSMCADTMALITRVIDHKPYKKPPVLIVDTGIYNGLIEAMEHFGFNIDVYTKHLESSRKSYFKIGGFSCDGTDVIRDKILLPAEISVGDLIAFQDAGAYTFVYEKFHMVDYPEIYCVESFINQHKHSPLSVLRSKIHTQFRQTALQSN